jgi:hypothetical protein
MPEDDIHRHALSWTSQPDLAELFRIVCDEGEKPVTIICGAGVSLDAGLPSWASLVDRMCGAVRNPKLINELRADPVDPMRKIGYVLDLAPRNRSDAEIIREALYGHEELVFPGPLADAIARLVRVAPNRFRLLTTNFDSNLEQALYRYLERIQALGLDNAEEWFRTMPDPDRVSVLHVHGMVAPQDDPVRPLILAETEFLRHGDTVRRQIARALRESHCLLVGASLNDPNILGPTFDLVLDREQGREPDTSIFLFVVPEVPVEDGDPGSWERSKEYSARRAHYFQEKFKLKAVNFRAFSQIPQVLRELPLAMENPTEYRSTNKKTSTRYGYRLRRTLAAAYQNCGAKRGQPCPTGDAAEEFRKKLAKAHAGPGGPLRLIRAEVQQMSEEYLHQHGLDLEYLDGEQFALFLWLRALPTTSPDRGGPYAIDLVGCSAYSHPQSWSFTRREPIGPHSDYPAAKALFFGTPRLENMADRRRSPLWRAMLAAPIMVTCAEGMDTLSLGVVTLNTNRSFAKPDELVAAAKNRQDVEEAYAPSIISFYNSEQLHALCESVQEAALKAIGFTPPSTTRARRMR